MYKPPVMKFEEITFFERIAHDQCWRNANFTFDNPYTYKKKETFPIKIKSNKCGDKESWSAIYQALSYLNFRDYLKYSAYTLFECNKQNTKMWGFTVEPS